VQVFLNILTNAVHAIPEGAPDKHEVVLATSTSERGAVVVEISDTGAGMSADVMARIFEPFFTTKPIGSGMGLGLSISHRLVSELGGSLTVTSRLGQGSTFRVELPADESVSAAPSEGLPVTTVLRDTPRTRLLVVDDEPQMCELISRMLDGDYEVTWRARARDALALLRQGTTFDGLLCDLMMPDLTGMDLHAELQRFQPELASRTLFMTGGTFTERASAFVATLSRHLLVKPIGPAQLVQRLHEMFAEQGTPTVHA
jgi:CheY-like chemotaxis protein